MTWIWMTHWTTKKNTSTSRAFGKTKFHDETLAFFGKMVETNQGLLKSFNRTTDVLNSQLDGLIDSKCLFWDFDFGWTWSSYDWSVFQRTEIGKKFLQGKFKPYKLMGNTTYPMRSCFILSFKGSKSGLSREKQYWNFIQSSTRMAVERTFGILKGRWRILLKRIHILLDNVPM